MSDERRSRLGRSVRAARRSFWVQVSVGTVIALGLGVVVTVLFGAPPVVAGPLVVLLIMGTGSLLGRRSNARSRNDGLTTTTKAGPTVLDSSTSPLRKPHRLGQGGGEMSEV